ncbi:hypothetical protein BpHYR1_036917, partial [Brachionus plicatilis]
LILIFVSLLEDSKAKCIYIKRGKIIDGLNKYYNETEFIKCLVNGTRSNLYLYNFDWKASIQYDFNVFRPRIMRIQNAELNQLVKVDQVKSLRIFEIINGKITKLEDDHLLPDSVEVISFYYNQITYIKPDFFFKFKNLTEVFLPFNALVSIDLLQFDSNSIWKIYLSSNSIQNLKRIEFNNSQSDPHFFIDVSFNHLKVFPKIVGNLKSIYKFKIHKQNNKKVLVNSLFNLDKNDSLIRIDNLVIDYDESKFILELFKKYYSIKSIQVNKNLRHKHTFNTDSGPIARTTTPKFSTTQVIIEDNSLDNFSGDIIELIKKCLSMVTVNGFLVTKIYLGFSIIMFFVVITVLEIIEDCRLSDRLHV